MLASEEAGIFVSGLRHMVNNGTNIVLVVSTLQATFYDLMNV